MGSIKIYCSVLNIFDNTSLESHVLFNLYVLCCSENFAAIRNTLNSYKNFTEILVILHLLTQSHKNKIWFFPSIVGVYCIQQEKNNWTCHKFLESPTSLAFVWLCFYILQIQPFITNFQYKFECKCKKAVSSMTCEIIFNKTQVMQEASLVLWD